MTKDLLNTLRRKGLVEVDDLLIEYRGEWHRIEPGDRYLGQHGDQSPELLTCRRLEWKRRGSGRTLGKLFPKERKDSKGNTPRLYTLNEVIKVVIRENPNYDPNKKESNRDRTQHLFPTFNNPSTTSEANANGGGNPGAVQKHDGPPAAGDDRGGQREDGARDAEAPRPAEPKPGPKPGPGPKRGAEHRDPRQPAGRTDYTAAGRKPD